ncbi:MAG: hypothetical protein AAF941_02335 [Pseudomonadota bacterium]
MRLSRPENSEFTRRRRKRSSIAAQPLFVPLMTAWGAALVGLSVAVLPDQTIDQLTSLSALGVLGEFARLFFVGLAAALGGAAVYFIAIKWRGSLPSNPNDLLSKVVQRVQPIDPVADLGSESLDAPIDEEIVPANDTSDIDPEIADTTEAPVEVTEPAPEVAEDDTLELSMDAVCEAEPEPPTEREPHLEPAKQSTVFPNRRAKGRKEARRVELVHALTDHMARKAAEAKAAAAKAAEADIPQAEVTSRDNDLDLGEFEQLPPVEHQTHAVPTTSHNNPVGSAVDKLRSVPPQELNLVQMVERLAIALHQHQEAARSKPQSTHEAKRDVALAEALKALSMFTEQGFNAEGLTKPIAPPEGRTEVELREALGKLQSLRGAA